MKKMIWMAVLACTLLGASPVFGQVKMTRQQILFYTSGWKGDRFPDGRPKLPDDLLKRAVNMTIEDIGISCALTGTTINLMADGRPFIRINLSRVER